MNNNFGETNNSTIIVRNVSPKKNINLAIGSLVCGIIGIISFWLPIWNFILSITGLIIGIIALAQKQKGHSQAIAGLVLSVVTLMLSLVTTVLYIFL